MQHAAQNANQNEKWQKAKDFWWWRNERFLAMSFGAKLKMTFTTSHFSVHV